jgi:hypothetical protein
MNGEPNRNQPARYSTFTSQLMSLFDAILWPLATQFAAERHAHLTAVGQSLLDAIGFLGEDDLSDLCL